MRTVKRITKRNCMLACSLLLLIGCNASKTDAQAITGEQSFHDFDVSNAVIPLTEIHQGGPPRDGIPALLDPAFVDSSSASWLRDNDIVVGLAAGDVAKAYPLRILTWHELVNDELNGTPVLVTYCPLCGTAMVFDRTMNGEALTFGVSGLLYQSDVLMYDHQSESLWSQLRMEAVSGPMVQAPLPWLPSSQMTWSKWRGEHPDTLVLSRDTPLKRNYAMSPYASYSKSSKTMFPVPKHRKDLPTKAWVLGVVVGGTAKAYPIDLLDEEPILEDRINGEPITIEWDAAARHGAAQSAGGEELPTVQVYWFAWQGFYPDTELYGTKQD